MKVISSCGKAKVIKNIEKSSPALEYPRRRSSIKFIEVVERQAQKLMFVLPGNLRLRKSLTFSWRWGWISDLGDQIRSRCFCNAIHKNTNERCFQDHSEAKGKTKQDTFAVEEPPTLLLWGILDATEIRFELVPVSSCLKLWLEVPTSSRIKLREAK